MLVPSGKMEASGEEARRREMLLSLGERGGVESAGAGAGGAEEGRCMVDAMADGEELAVEELWHYVRSHTGGGQSVEEFHVGLSKTTELLSIFFGYFACGDLSIKLTGSPQKVTLSD